MKRPLVSIIVDNHNYAQFLPEAIESALGQSYDEVEVIVVDDGSTDGSRKVIETYGTAIVAFFQEQRGQTAAFNVGVRRARGEIVCFLDADDVLLPNTIERAVEAFSSDDVVNVHWRLRQVSADGTATDVCWPSVDLVGGDLRETLLADGPDTEAMPPSSGHAWRRSFLESVMPLPEVEREFGVGSANADTRLYMLARLYGKVGCLDGVGGLYRVHGSNDYASLALDDLLAREVPLYEHRCDLLAEHCGRVGIVVDAEVWKVRGHHRRLKEGRETILAAVAPGETFVLLDDDQWNHHHGDREVLERRYALPFPERDGQYWGLPSDSAQAIAELERMRAEGIRTFVVAWSAFWWLDHYADFAYHLRARYRCVVDSENMLAFDLADSR